MNPADQFPRHPREMVGRMVTLEQPGRTLRVLVVNYTMNADGTPLTMVVRSGDYPDGALIPWHSVLAVTDIDAEQHDPATRTFGTSYEATHRAGGYRAWQWHWNEGASTWSGGDGPLGGGGHAR